MTTTYLHPHEAEEREFAMGPRLWDADPEVCCAAFQLGACSHTEAGQPDGYDVEPSPTQPRPPAAAPDVEPF